VTVSGIRDQPGVAADLMTALADRLVNVDTIIQNVSDHGTADLSFTVPLDELSTALEAVESLRASLGIERISSDDQMGKVSLVGAGMKSNPGVAAKMFRALAAEGINLEMIDTSTIRITVVIKRQDVERAVRCLHDAFDLGSEAARRANV
jgi:aspartate kinase